MPIPGFTMIAPEVAAQPGLVAVLTLPEPSVTDSAQVRYGVHQTDVTADTTAEAPLSGGPVVDSGIVTLTVIDLIEGHEYVFTYTMTGADGITATSAPSSPITATT